LFITFKYNQKEKLLIKMNCSFEEQSYGGENQNMKSKMYVPGVGK
jgi:hypothetical protein